MIIGQVSSPLQFKSLLIDLLLDAIRLAWAIVLRFDLSCKSETFVEELKLSDDIKHNH